MSEHPPTGVAPDWQRWQIRTAEAWPAPQDTEARMELRTEVLVAVVITAYSVLLGGVVGLIWPRVAPHIRLADAIFGSEAATKALLGDDMWLALLGAIAGLVVVAVAFVTARDAVAGPGGVVGLAVGGVLGSLVAAQVGHLVQHPHVVAALHAGFPTLAHHQIATILGYFDFRVRARAVLVAWPLAAVMVHSAVTTLRNWLNSRRSGTTAP